MTHELITIPFIRDNIKDLESFAGMLNEPPKPEWLQKTPDKKGEYIPIGIIENELRKDFMNLVQYELISERRELNEIIVIARIKVFYPFINQWLSFDGIGACVIMQDAESKLQDFLTTKKKNALELNAPNAYSEAIKNAAKKIGVKYGSNINRKFQEVYEPNNTIEAVLNDAKKILVECKSLEEVKNIWDSNKDLQKFNKFKFEISKQKNKIENGKL